MKITKKLAQQVETAFEQLGYDVRYGKGNFKGGCCMLDEQQIIVLNRYYPFESRIQTLIDLLLGLPLENSSLDEGTSKLMAKLRQATQTPA